MGQDGVNTSRIPGLPLKAGNAAGDLRMHDTKAHRDLQGHIDVAMNRSLDGGRTWNPMQVVLDRNEWGGMPENTTG